MKDEKPPLSPLEQHIFDFVDNQRAEFRLYPDLWVRELVTDLVAKGVLVEA